MHIYRHHARGMSNIDDITSVRRFTHNFGHNPGGRGADRQTTGWTTTRESADINPGMLKNITEWIARIVKISHHAVIGNGPAKHNITLKRESICLLKPGSELILKCPHLVIVGLPLCPKL